MPLMQGIVLTTAGSGLASALHNTRYGILFRINRALWEAFLRGEFLHLSWVTLEKASHALLA